MNRDEKFRLYANCIPVKGARRSTICDLQRNDYRFIPNALFDILSKHQDKSVNEIVSIYGEGNRIDIEEYIDFLLREELGFYCDEPELFLKLSMTWDAASKITNAIIDIEQADQFDLLKISKELDDLGCKALQLRYTIAVPMCELIADLDKFSTSRIRTIHLALPFHPDYSESEVKNLCNTNGRVHYIQICNAYESKKYRVEGRDTLVSLTRKNIDYAKDCGLIKSDYFQVNIELFTESQKYNTCLNRKISIDSRGNIKNCPSCEESYGDINETPLSEVLLNDNFSQKWKIRKDEVTVCQDCEFRHICTDCRVYLSEPGNIYSKPAKCNYDPYKAEWQSTDSQQLNCVNIE